MHYNASRRGIQADYRRNGVKVISFVFILFVQCRSALEIDQIVNGIASPECFDHINRFSPVVERQSQDTRDGLIV